MARKKKEAKIVTFYLANEIIDKLDNYCEETGLPKTTAVEKFILNSVQSYEREKRRLSNSQAKTNDVVI